MLSPLPVSLFIWGSQNKIIRHLIFIILKCYQFCMLNFIIYTMQVKHTHTFLAHLTYSVSYFITYFPWIIICLIIFLFVLYWVIISFFIPLPHKQTVQRKCAFYCSLRICWCRQVWGAAKMHLLARSPAVWILKCCGADIVVALILVHQDFCWIWKEDYFRYTSYVALTIILSLPLAKKKI